MFLVVFKQQRNQQHHMEEQLIYQWNFIYVALYNYTKETNILPVL